MLSVTAIETSGADETYQWDKITGADGFERVTLFQHADAQKLPAREVAHQLALALEKIQPAVVMIPGWSDSAALGALRWCLEHGVPAICMSESTAGDETRRVWREAVKRQIVRLCSAALAGGTPHGDYLVQLGLPAERVFLGYDAVDNAYFAAGAAKWQKQKAEKQKAEIFKSGVGSQKVESRTWETNNTSPRPSPQSGEGEATAEKTPTLKVETGNAKAETLKPESRNGEGENGKQKIEKRNAFQLSTLPISAFQNSPFFLASARFIEKKNLIRLIEAYARYRQKAETLKTENLKSKPELGSQQSVVSSSVVPWSLVVLGDGALRSSLESQVSSLGLADFVRMPGFKQYPELPAYYAHAGAFIHASTTEQWGLVVNEAMASGLPVLVSNRCGCAQDLVQDGVNGFTFDPYNVEQLAQLMLRISDFRFPISDFGQASQRLIANWGPARFAEGLKQAVECALKVGPVKPSFVQRLILKALLWK